MSEHFDYIRGVSGWGPRCACGGESELHVGYGSPNEPSIFLCAGCVTEAVSTFLLDTGQAGHWPGDEGRDERYVDPRQETRS